MMEYVASGSTHIHYEVATAKDTQCLDVMNRVLGHAQGKHDHMYSLLFNALTERKTIRMMDPGMTNSYRMYSDSGGLQLVTQGKVVDDAIKNEIYDIQNKHSDVAMCFDEIPVKFTGATGGGMNDNSSRYFDADNFDHYARETGKNVFNQIKTFVESDGQRAKPLLIIHGNNLDYMRKWVDLALSEIPQDYHQYIYGLASAGPSLGTGPLEDVERFSVLGLLEIDDRLKENIHLLGIGSVRRLLPILMYKKSGFISPTAHISYDSTSHTAGITMGRYYINGRFMETPQPNLTNHTKVFADLRSQFEYVIDDFKFDEQDYLRVMSTSFSKVNAKGVVYDINAMMVYYVLYVFGSILNFTKHVESLCTDDKVLDELLSVRGLNEYKYLGDIKSYADYQHWRSHVGRYMKSKPVLTKQSDFNLNSLFL